MDGLELAARFSYSPNSLQYCGYHKAGAYFKRYLTKRDNGPVVEKVLTTFQGLYPYLSAIAKKHKKHYTDHDVVEAYWIGNELLEAFTREDLHDIIRTLVHSGLRTEMGDLLIVKLPVGFFPHHLFQVMYVGVGRTTGTVETTVENMERCRPSWGKVVRVADDLAFVETQSLVKVNGKYVLGSLETKTVKVLPEFFSSLDIGTTIAMHWGYATLALSELQLKNLQFYTQKTIDLLNAPSP